MRRGASRLTFGTLLLLAGLLSGRAGATTGGPPLYVIAVGFNGVPPLAVPDDERVRPLRYADDDAADIYALFREAGDGGALLTTLDAETQRLHPELADVTRPPSLVELRSAVRETVQRIAADRSAGVRPTVIFFYSGHGFAGEAGPGLALQDGALSARLLYDEVIRPLSVGRLHILVDACHAEAVVRPRDAQAEEVDVTPGQAEAYLRQTTLAGYPDVGAIIATTRGARAHEWEVYGAGVFTHELLSGLRGGADVNGDGRIEYSEIAAFLSAANHDVADPRARLESIVRAPLANVRAPLIDLNRLTKAGRLRGRPGHLNRFYVENQRGLRVLDLHAERDYAVTLVVPAGQTLYVRTRDAEAEISVGPGQILSLDDRPFRPLALAPRGAIESELRRGLFGATFGPGYYLGYADQSGLGASVVLARDADGAPVTEPPRPWRRAAWTSFAVAAALGAAALGVGVAAVTSYREVVRTPWQVPATEARDRYIDRRDLALGLGAAAASVAGAGAILWRVQPEITAPQVARSGGGMGLTFAGTF